MRMIKTLVLLVLMMGMSIGAMAYNKLPPSTEALFITQLVAYEKVLREEKDIVVYVMKAPEVAKALNKIIGTDIGTSKLAKVISGDLIPDERYDILYIGAEEDVQTAIYYTRKFKVLSVTGNTSLVDDGVTLGLGTSGGKPKYLLNLSAARAEGATWDPAVLRFELSE